MQPNIYVDHHFGPKGVISHKVAVSTSGQLNELSLPYEHAFIFTIYGTEDIILPVTKS